MAVKPYAFFGAGMVYDKTNQTTYLGFGEIGVTFETASIEIPKGNFSLTTNRKSLRAGISGTASWHYASANQLAILTGGSVTAPVAGSGISVAKEESHTIPASPGPYTVDVTNKTTFVAGTIGDNSVYSVAAGVKTWFENGAAAASGVFTESAGTLTFDATDAETVVYITYLYTNATGSYVTIDPQDTPAKFEGYFTVEAVDETTGASDYVTFHALKAEWTGNFTYGAPREGHNVISRDFFLNNDASGDIIVHFG